MPYHSAKESFPREEILEILRRNVALYKNEPEFVNYIVDLALYLLEQCEMQDLDGPPSSLPSSPLSPSAAAAAGAREAPAAPAIAPAEAPEAAIEVVPKAADEDFKWDSVLKKRSQLQVSAEAQPSPPPPGDPEKVMPRVQIDRGGRTRVYKVFRAHSTTAEELHCPVCGTQNSPKARFCKSCGTVL